MRPDVEFLRFLPESAAELRLSEPVPLNYTDHDTVDVGATYLYYLIDESRRMTHAASIA